MVKRDTSKLSRRDKLELVLSEAPELPALLGEVRAQLETLTESVQPLVSNVTADLGASKDGLVYLRTRQQLLLAYCMNVCFYMVLKVCDVWTCSRSPCFRVDTYPCSLMHSPSLLSKRSLFISFSLSPPPSRAHYVLVRWGARRCSSLLTRRGGARRFCCTRVVCTTLFSSNDLISADLCIYLHTSCTVRWHVADELVACCGGAIWLDSTPPGLKEPPAS